MNFFVPGRHFLTGTTINDIDMLGAQTQGGPGRIHGHVAAADNGDFLAPDDRGIVFREQVGLHQIRAGQIFVGGTDAVQVLTGNPHKFRQPGPGPHERGVETFIEEVIHGDDLTHDHIIFEADTHLFQIGYFRVNDHFRQPEFRDTVNQHPAGFMKGFKNGDIVSLLGQVTGAGQPGRPGADNGDFFIGFFPYVRWFRDALIPFEISGKTLQDTDGHRFGFDADDTFLFTLFFLGTDPAANGR